MSAPTSDRPLSDGSDPVLDEVVEEIANRIQAGEPVDGEALLAKYPDRADSIRRLLPAMEVMAEFGISASRLAAAGVSPGLSPHTVDLGVLGDFRILREVGRGGMGVVYEAEQMSLGRRVALKVLPFAGALDSHQLRRFRTEAQAAAQLHHSNIVPVFWIGSEQGVHYYAMQFIDGRTLADVIHELRHLEGKDRRNAPAGQGEISADPAASALASVMTQAFPPPPLREDVPPPAAAPSASAGPIPVLRSGASTRDRAYFRNVARLGMEAAEALEHAHQEGIVHRDIKPANLMIDVKGHLWVTDFGLARLQNESGLTLTGDVLGTLRYMSPEQALGRRRYLDHRADIYSLGATLYELVTLRPMFDGKDRQEILARIARDEPVPPRRLDPAIPRELETILLKATSKEPEDRYATAQALAEDLRWFLENKPIKARRPTLLERAAKWSRRHPTYVAFGFILLAVIAIGLAIGSTLLARKQVEVSRQRDRANELARIADSQRARAEQNARLTRRAVDEMFTQVAEKWLADQPRLEPLQREFLEKALRLYEELARQEEADPSARQAVADAWERVGRIRRRLGLLAPAEEALRRSLAINTALADASPTDPELRYRTTKPYLTLALVLLDDSRPIEAAEAYRRAKEMAQSLTDGQSGPPDYRAALSDAYAGLGLINSRLRNYPEAERALSQAISIHEGLIQEYPQDRRYRSLLANDLNNLCATRIWAGRLDEARTACRRAIELRQRLVEQSPDSREYRADLADSIMNLGTICYMMKEIGEAEAQFRRALPIRRRLVAEFPRIPEYGYVLSACLDNLAGVLRNSGRAAEAEPLRREAVAVLEGVVRTHPDMPEHRTALGMCLINMGVLLKDIGKEAEAEAIFERAMELMEPLIAEHPELPERFIRFLECARARGGILHDLGRDPEAEAVFRRAIDFTDRVAARSPRVPGFVQQRIHLLADFARFLMAVHRDAEARESLRRAIALTEGSSDAAPQNVLAWILATSPDLQLRDPERAVHLAKRAVELQPSAAGYWNTLGVAHYRAGDPTSAIEALEKSIQFGAGGSPADWIFLAMAHWKLDHKDQARKWYTQAADKMEKEKSNDEELLRFRAEAEALMGLIDTPKSTATKEESTQRPPKP